MCFLAKFTGNPSIASLSSSLLRLLFFELWCFCYKSDRTVNCEKPQNLLKRMQVCHRNQAAIPNEKLFYHLRELWHSKPTESFEMSMRNSSPWRKNKTITLRSLGDFTFLWYICLILANKPCRVHRCWDTDRRERVHSLPSYCLYIALFLFNLEFDRFSTWFNAIWQMLLSKYL